MAGPGFDDADEAKVDLLIKQVAEGLSPAEQRELDVMDSAAVAEALRELERAAAALTLVGTSPVEPPPALRALLERQAGDFIEQNTVVEFKAPPPPLPPPPLPPLASRAASRSGRWGWIAAAACLVLAVFGWLRQPPPAVAPVPTVQLGPPAEPRPQPVQPAPPPTPAEERLALLAQPDAVRVTLKATKDPAAAGVTGDAVWDPKSQQGYLHFVGLAANDPAVRQYQIWVFDAKRDKRYPVAAGMFDVPADAAELVIPIHASLPIGQPKAFAVTVEQPGGVVVSGLAHVVVLGAVG